MSDYAEDTGVAFAMYADINNLSLEEDIQLAEKIAEEVGLVAEERASIPGIKRDTE